MLALDGETDGDLAPALGLALPTIKSRWQTNLRDGSQW